MIEWTIGPPSTVGRPYEAFYVRTSDQYELDLVLDFDGELWALKIELTSTPATSDMARLDRAVDMTGASL